MYSVIETRAGKVLILNKLVSDVQSLLNKTINSLNHQQSEFGLLCWVVNIFSEDFEEDYGQYPQETLEKFALCVLNARHFLIEDKEQFCCAFEDEGLDLEIGFDRAFYPVGLGCWYDTAEFIIMDKGA